MHIRQGLYPFKGGPGTSSTRCPLVATVAMLCLQALHYLLVLHPMQRRGTVFLEATNKHHIIFVPNLPSQHTWVHIHAWVHIHTHTQGTKARATWITSNLTPPHLFPTSDLPPTIPAAALQAGSSTLHISCKSHWDGNISVDSNLQYLTMHNAVMQNPSKHMLPGVH